MVDAPSVTQRASGSGTSQRESEYQMIPPADILEDSSGITLQLDMPGVARDRLRIEADKDTLLIEGDMQLAMQPGMTPLYADIQSMRYSRSFTLSGELDPDKISATLSNGVLTLKIPLRSELKPRKIEIQVA